MKKGRELGFLPSITGARTINDVWRLFTNWRLVGNSVIDDRRRRRFFAVSGFLFLAFLLHIVCWLRGGVKVQCVFVAVPHNEITCRQQIINGAAIAAIRDAEGVLECGRAESEWETILIATKVEIYGKGNTG